MIQIFFSFNIGIKIVVSEKVLLLFGKFAY